MKHMQLSVLMLLASFAVSAHPAAGQAPVPIPQGTYRYSGTVEGRPLGGTIELGEFVTVTASRGGICRPQIASLQLYRSQKQVRKLTVSCGEQVVLEWDAAGRMLPFAEVSLPIEEEELRRGACLQWNETAGRRTTCAQYEQRLVRTTRMGTGRVKLEPEA